MVTRNVGLMDVQRYGYLVIYTLIYHAGRARHYQDKLAPVGEVVGAFCGFPCTVTIWDK